MSIERRILRAIGSLWFAAVLLMLLLVAMAYATVYESVNDAEQALVAFYRSIWFEALLCLVCVNVAAAVFARYPFTRKQAGFVITHAAIVLTLGGALITSAFGVNGQVGIAEGQRVERFSVLSEDALTISSREDQSLASMVLDSPAFHGDRAVEHPRAETLTLDEAEISVLRYLPDTLWLRKALDVEDPNLKPAIEVSFAAAHGDSTAWVFAEQRPVTVGPTSVSFRVASSAAELDSLLSQEATSRETRVAFARFPGFSHGEKEFADVDLTFESGSVDIVKVVCGGETYEIPLEQCRDKPVPVGDTGYTVRVLRYLPHATVGPDRKLTNASDKPENPAIEVEIAGPPALSGGEQEPPALLEIVSGPDGRMYVPLQQGDATLEPRELTLGTPIDTPWSGHQLAVLRRFEHAQVEWSLEPHDSVREEPEPGVLVEIRTPEHTEEMWVQKGRPRSVQIADTSYELTYDIRELPLGFGLTLNSFRLGTYPGSERPRSYESQITTEDPVTGRIQNHVISMNHPATIGGYTLYQSSYRQSASGPAISFLSVSRDPGKPVVFAGYIAMMIGMLVLLWTRVAQGRARAVAAPPASASPSGACKNSDLKGSGA